MRLLLSLFFASIFAMSCGLPQEDETSDLLEATDALMVDVEKTSEGEDNDDSDLDVDIDVTRDCRFGGTVRFQKQLAVSQNPRDSKMWKRWTYDACAFRRNLTLDGFVQVEQHLYTADVEENARKKMLVDVAYDGDLTYSGRVNSTCTMDVDYSGDARGVPLVSIVSRFCLHPRGQPIQPR